ncbi:MAG: hypothetical protein WBG86_18845 [Polyangiales bacterium]
MTAPVDIEIITHSDRVEALLDPYRITIGRDFDGYRGHIYRVLTYAMHFLGGDPSARPVIEAALVYHDLGLWTHHELAYLEPSTQLAQHDNETHGWGFDSELLHDLIYWHHKITPFSGPHAELVNAVRKADWIDASAGTIRKGMPRPFIGRVTQAIPAAGFYDALKRLGPELTGSVWKSVGPLLKVYKY